MPLRSDTEPEANPQSAALFESNGSGDEEQGAPASRRPAATAAAIRERKRKAARARHSRSQQRSTTRAVKGEPAVTAAPAGPANAVPPAPVLSQPSPPMIADNKAVPNPTITSTPSQVGQSACATPTPTLKIRLPRFSLGPASLSTKSTPASPVQVRTSERSRRSLRRQTSTTGSSSTSISKVDGRTSAAESPRE